MSPTLFQHLPRYYAYRHIRKDICLPFYVGIGTQNLSNKPYQRAIDRKKRTAHWKNVANKFGYDVEIFYESNDQIEVKEKEIEFIRLYGRRDLKKGILVNKGDGGDLGRQPTQTEIDALIFRNKINKYNKGKKLSLLTRKKMSTAKDSHNGDRASKKIPIVQCDKYGRIVAEYESITKAAKILGKQKGVLSTCVKVRKQIDGFIFKRKD